MSTLPRWASRGFKTGVALSLPVPVAVVLVAIYPDLKFGYPLVLLLLLAVGPLAVYGLRPLRGIPAALLAGPVSAILAAGSLAISSQVLGTSVWTLTSAASAPPMPPLPRMDVLPFTVMSWAQQDILLFQPVLALALGALAIATRVIGRIARALPSSLLPRSVRMRLMLANGGVLALTFMVGWVGFASLEEMHFRGHLLQLQSDWKHHLLEIEAALDAEQIARASGRDDSLAVAAAQRSLAQLADDTPRPGISVGAAGIRDVRARYQTALSLLTTTYTAYRAQPDNADAFRSTRSALNILRRQVEDQVRELAAADDLIHPNDVQKLHGFLEDVERQADTTPRVEWRIHHADGTWIYTETVGNNLLDDPDVSGLVLNSQDIGDRRALQDQLTYQAFHDPLTSLPNRALFMDRLEHALIRADRREQAVALVFLDLDNFKIVNDSLGHQAGDQMLIAAAERLLDCVRTEDTVARLGGDEFTILIEDVRGLDSALEVAERIALKLRSPFAVVGHEVFSTASIGIAVSGTGVESSADLLRNADLAMYRAKSEGKSRHAVFDGAMNAQAMKRLELETALRRAVDRDELRLMYQPIMSLDEMGIDRVETLVRWQHPERGLVSPADFIPIAEETGLIVPIGQWVLGEACRQAREWQREMPYAPPIVMSVNLSPRQFQHPTLVEDITRILGDTGLAPERLYAGFRGHYVKERWLHLDLPIYRSDDDGKTWRHSVIVPLEVSGPKSQERNYNVLTAVVADPAETDRVYVGLMTSSSRPVGPLQSSTDGGTSWKRLDVGEAKHVLGVALGVDRQNLYAVTDLGLYRLRLR